MEPSIAVESVTASHTGDGSASPRNAVDGLSATAWQAPHSEEGEWIRLRFAEVERVETVGLIAGYDKVLDDKYRDRWPKNHRASEIVVAYEGGSMRFNLEDRRGMQWVTLGGVSTKWIRIRVVDVYRGSAWDDVAISEIQVRGSSPPPAIETPAEKADSEIADTAPTTSLAASAEELPPTLAERLPSPPQNPALTFVGLLGVLGIGGLGFAATRSSNRRRRDANLLKRARAAMTSIQSDAEALGPLYAPVLTASTQLMTIATDSMDHLSAARDALRRTRRLLSPGATEHRERLLSQERLALGRVTTLVERLEDTMAHLVAVRADRHSPHDVEEIIARLNEEVVLAVAAEEEVSCSSN